MMQAPKSKCKEKLQCLNVWLHVQLWFNESVQHGKRRKGKKKPTQVFKETTKLRFHIFKNGLYILIIIQSLKHPSF